MSVTNPMSQRKDSLHARWVVVFLSLFVLAVVNCNGGDNSDGTVGSAAQVSREPETQEPRSTPTATVGTATTLAILTPTQTPTPLSTPKPPETTATASPVPSPTASPTPEPTATASPTASPTPSPSPTPEPTLLRLTSGECCTQPFWLPDSEAVLFIDKPGADAPLGIWGVQTDNSNATPSLFTERIAPYTADLGTVVEYGGSETIIERLAGPLSDTVVERWTVPAGGHPVSISPGGTRIAWTINNGDVPVERRVTEVWVAKLDGSDARPVITVPRGGFAGWVSDEVMLLTGRESLESRETVVYALSLADGATVELLRAQRPRGLRLSPDRRWLAVFRTFSEDPADNGIWLVRTDGSEQRHLDLELFGDFAWRDEGRLLILPFKPEAVYHELWQYDVETDQARQLTDPGRIPFKVANGDWSVSPDGRNVAFVESSDHNVWLLMLVD